MFSWNVSDTFYWPTQSTEAGDVDAMFSLGHIHYYRAHISMDDVRASMWFDLAARDGLKVAKRYYDESAKTLSPTQIQDAEQLA